ncbi:hypothetical protein [Bacteriovorax sp. Seq25_V]|uniref:hypothetical protein n=1 Tax=Bacteriovorax sp. Seq25_V TaxID=1201288 RepID=UPI0018DF0D6D|nr:hypothetical protein [Bacteriovorax sp. Seq25_V]
MNLILAFLFYSFVISELPLSKIANIKPINLYLCILITFSIISNTFSAIIFKRPFIYLSSFRKIPEREQTKLSHTTLLSILTSALPFLDLIYFVKKRHFSELNFTFPSYATNKSKTIALNQVLIMTTLFLIGSTIQYFSIKKNTIEESAQKSIEKSQTSIFSHKNSAEEILAFGGDINKNFYYVLLDKKNKVITEVTREEKGITDYETLISFNFAALILDFLKALTPIDLLRFNKDEIQSINKTEPIRLTKFDSMYLYNNQIECNLITQINKKITLYNFSSCELINNNGLSINSNSETVQKTELESAIENQKQEQPINLNFIYSLMNLKKEIDLENEQNKIIFSKLTQFYIDRMKDIYGETNNTIIAKLNRIKQRL